MAKFTLQFDCDNDVFADYPEHAVADALLTVSKKIRQGSFRGVPINHADGWVSDNNGNRIGAWQYRDR